MDTTEAFEILQDVVNDLEIVGNAGIKVELTTPGGSKIIMERNQKTIEEAKRHKELENEDDA